MEQHSMRWVTAAILIGLAAVSAPAQQEAARAQVAAATADAVKVLYAEIAQITVARNVTVQDLLDRTGAKRDFVKTLQRAEQIGGPRWIDDQTAQVQLEISGARVAQALLRIAAANRDRSPIPPEQLAVRLREWDQRTFSATGTSTAPHAIEHIRPPAAPGEAWAAVTDTARRQTVKAAREDAIGRIMQSLEPIVLLEDQRIGDILAHPPVQQELHQWLIERPVTRVDFQEDLEIELVLSAPPDEIVDLLQSSVRRHRILPRSPSDAEWQRVRQEVEQEMAEPVGRAQVPPEGVVEAPPELPLPEQPPQWVERQIDAEGHSPFVGQQLRTARAAEADAIEKLHAHIRQLPLTPEQTLGEAAEKHPAVKESLSRALTHARTFKADYHPDGSARVRVSLDLREVWQELRAQ